MINVASCIGITLEIYEWRIVRGRWLDVPIGHILNLNEWREREKREENKKVSHHRREIMLQQNYETL